MIAYILRGLQVSRQAARVVTRKAFSPRYLLATNCVASGALASSADVVVQALNHRNREGGIDAARTGRLTFAAIATGAVCHYWYRLIDGVIVGRTWQVVMKKVLLDQMIMSPVCIVAWFALMGLLEGAKPRAIEHQLRTKGKELYLTELVVSPPIQLINFRFLPTKYRVVYDCSICFFYDIYYYYKMYEEDGKVSTMF